MRSQRKGSGVLFVQMIKYVCQAHYFFVWILKGNSFMSSWCTMVQTDAATLRQPISDCRSEINNRAALNTDVA
jgi:hypothetical protein